MIEIFVKKKAIKNLTETLHNYICNLQYNRLYFNDFMLFVKKIFELEEILMWKLCSYLQHIVQRYYSENKIVENTQKSKKYNSNSVQPKIYFSRKIYSQRWIETEAFFE